MLSTKMMAVWISVDGCWDLCHECGVQIEELSFIPFKICFHTCFPHILVTSHLLSLHGAFWKTVLGINIAHYWISYSNLYSDYVYKMSTTELCQLILQHIYYTRCKEVTLSKIKVISYSSSAKCDLIIAICTVWVSHQMFKRNPGIYHCFFDTTTLYSYILMHFCCKLLLKGWKEWI